MKTPTITDRNEIKLAFQLAGWLPFDPDSMTRVRDFDLAKTQAAHMAGDLSGLLRECRATAWTQLQKAIPGRDVELVYCWVIRLEMAIRTHFILAGRIQFEILTLCAKSSRVELWLLRRGNAGLWLSKQLSRRLVLIRTMRIHWKIFNQMRRAKSA